MKKHTEIRFEEAIEYYLTEQTKEYNKGDSREYDNQTAIFPKDVIDFISKSQPNHWKHIVEYNGVKSNEILLTSLVKELDNKGSLYVLRHGFKCFGRNFKLAYFKPNTNLNPEAWEDFKKNIVKIYRQVHFSKTNENLSLDVVIAVNGIPVVTMELKNQLSGQNVENAKRQYKEDRDPRELIFQFKKRALVHFAIDTEEVYMTTKLEGSDTFFLPFNKGFNLGSGNPPVEDNYRTAYLWEDILSKDSLLDLIGKYLHLEIAEKKVYTEKGVIKKKKETLIFPRFHQLDVVRKLLDNAKEKGSGHNYLVQHSAGSGKSNSIAWLSHHLANFYQKESDKERLFDSIIVVTDRRVLDQQLQNTIKQFEQTTGVVIPIEKNARQLKEALESGKDIIISTIQKFPVISEEMTKFNGKRFAVIVDEAHSGQAGEDARHLKKTLSAKFYKLYYLILLKNLLYLLKLVNFP